MRKINKFSFVFLLITIYKLLIARVALAVCPVCTIAVGAGLGLSRFLGIDDSVSGVWAGGLTLSSSFWLSDWLARKLKSKYKLPRTKVRGIPQAEKFVSRFYPRAKLLDIVARNKTWLVAILMYGLVFIPLWFAEIIGHPFNTIWGIDKFIFGAVVGSATFLKTVWLDRKVRQIKGKQLFSYQKVVFPIIGLLLASLVLFLITSVKISLQ